MVQLFVSHISEEKDVAILLKDMMEEDFLGLVEFFASSDVGTIELGVQWLEAVEQAIQKADAVIVLCSKASPAALGAVRSRRGLDERLADHPGLPFGHDAHRPRDAPEGLRGR